MVLRGLRRVQPAAVPRTRQDPRRCRGGDRGDDVTEESEVVALAAQIDELRQQLDQARRDVATAKAVVAQWNARLEQEGIGATLVMRHAFKKLGEKVDGLATTLADALERGKLKTPAAPRWD